MERLNSYKKFTFQPTEITTLFLSFWRKRPRPTRTLRNRGIQELLFTLRLEINLTILGEYLDLIFKRIYIYLNMWVICERKWVQKAIKKAPKDIVRRYEVWKKIVELSGPQGLKLIKSFRDEALRGEWKGYRSSRLGAQWRIIYKVEKDLFEVYVFEINPHDYRKKK